MVDHALEVRAAFVHRRIPLRPSHLKVDQATGKVLRPSSAAFSPDEDGLSVYLDSVLAARRVALPALRTKPEQALAGLDEAAITDAGLSVAADPDGLDPNTDRGAAHALIKGWEAMSKREVAVAKDALACACFCTLPDQWPHPVG